MSPVLTLLSENWAPLSNLRTGLSHFPSVTSMIVSCSGPSDTSSSFKKRDDAYFLIFAILTFPFPCWRPLLSESAQPCAKADARDRHDAAQPKNSHSPSFSRMQPAGPHLSSTRGSAFS